MKTKSEKEPVTRVVFRKFKSGEIIALFPDEVWAQFQCSSYMHVGQHSGAIYSVCVRGSKLATKEEYLLLYNELVSIGYNLKTIKRK